MNTEHIDSVYYNDTVKANLANPAIIADIKIKQLQDTLERYRERALELEGVPEEINKYIREHEKEVCHGFVLGGAVERLKAVISHYRNVATSTMSGAERYRDDLQAWLRGLAITLEMTGNAQTHAEKNARLRGALELLETVITKLREERFDFNRFYWRFPDSFRSDFPTRDLLQSLHQTKDELEQARREIARLNGKGEEGGAEDTNISF